MIIVSRLDDGCIDVMLNHCGNIGNDGTRRDWLAAASSQPQAQRQAVEPSVGKPPDHWDWQRLLTHRGKLATPGSHEGNISYMMNFYDKKQQTIVQKSQCHKVKDFWNPNEISFCVILQVAMTTHRWGAHWLVAWAHCRYLCHTASDTQQFKRGTWCPFYDYNILFPYKIRIYFHNNNIKARKHSKVMAT